jgi:hypothetical protein
MNELLYFHDPKLCTESNSSDSSSRSIVVAVQKVALQMLEMCFVIQMDN